MPSLKSSKMAMEGPDTKVKGGPIKGVKNVSLGKEHKVKGFSFEGPDKSGGGWVKGGK
jgi:hypothetical protein